MSCGDVFSSVTTSTSGDWTALTRAATMRTSLRDPRSKAAPAAVVEVAGPAGADRRRRRRSGRRDRVSRPVVRVPRLRLELHEDGGPLVLIRKVHHQAAILKHPVIARELTGVALVHVDVVDAVAGQEAEVLVLDARPPVPTVRRTHTRRAFSSATARCITRSTFSFRSLSNPGRLNGSGRIWRRSNRLPLMKSSAAVPGLRSRLVNPLRNGSRTSVIGC